MQDHPFFGNWMPRGDKSKMSQGALDFINGKSLNGDNLNNKNHDELIQDFQDKKKALKEMEKSLTPEDRKLMMQAMGMGQSDSSNSVADRFRAAMKNINKK